MELVCRVCGFHASCSDDLEPDDIQADEMEWFNHLVCPVCDSSNWRFEEANLLDTDLALFMQNNELVIPEPPDLIDASSTIIFPELSVDDDIVDVSDISELIVPQLSLDENLVDMSEVPDMSEIVLPQFPLDENLPSIPENPDISDSSSMLSELLGSDNGFFTQVTRNEENLEKPGTIDLNALRERVRRNRNQ